MNASLEYRDVVRHFSGARPAVDHLSITLSAGSCCCLLGPNGAGKTTSILMLMGFLPITSGDIFVNGVSVRGDPDGARAHISYVPDEVALYENLSGVQNLRFFHSLLGQRLGDDHYAKLIADVGLAPAAAHRRVKHYSKGMRQRLAIAVALLKNASIYVFDEPTTGLDPRGIKSLIEIINGLREQGKIVLVTTHDLLRVNEFATEVMFLLRGKLERRLAADELKNADVEAIFLELSDREAKDQA